MEKDKARIDGVLLNPLVTVQENSPEKMAVGERDMIEIYGSSKNYYYDPYLGDLISIKDVLP